MTKHQGLGRSGSLATVASLVEDLRGLGLRRGSNVIVHSSLSRLGYVCGGSQAVVLALLEAVGADGTVVMPTHSTDLSDPAGWSRPPVPEAWWSTMREEMPAYDPGTTPTRHMGAVVECFRHVPGVLRSDHPTVSVAAVGPLSSQVVSNHELAHGLGEGSPLARLYELDAFVLLLGVSHANNTSLHLAEYRAAAPAKAWTTHASPVVVDGKRTWVLYPDLEGDDSDFERLGRDFAATGGELSRPVGAGTGRLMRIRDVVDFATEWMNTNRCDPQPADG